jgi:hypothetical protein
MPDIGQWSFDERFGLMIDREDIERRNKSFQNRIRKAQFKDNACVEDTDYSPPRGVKKSTILNFVASDWLVGRQNIIVTGPTGTGKTYVACTIAQAACRAGYTAKYVIKDFNKSAAEGEGANLHGAAVQETMPKDPIIKAI